MTTLNISLILTAAICLLLNCLLTISFSHHKLKPIFKISPYLVGGAFVSILTTQFISLSWHLPIYLSGFCVSSLSLAVLSLVLFISLNIQLFSRNYLKGDDNQGRFFRILSLLTASVFIMMLADHFLLFTLFWGVCNVLLAMMMIHKSKWVAAKNSGMLALKTHLISAAFFIYRFCDLLHLFWREYDH